MLTEKRMEEFLARKLANTGKTYRSHLEHYLRWRGDRPDTALVMNEFLLHLRAQGKKPATQASARAALKSYYRWGTDIAEIEDRNPTVKIQSIRIPRPRPRALTEAEVTRILAVADKRSVRDAAIIRVLYSTGVRVGELAGMEIADLNLEECRILIRHAKGGESRDVYFAPETKTKPALLRWRFQRGTAPGSLFGLGIKRIQRIIEEVGVDAGVEGLHPHLFRSTFVTRLLVAGVRAEIVARLVGDTVSTILTHYAQVTPEECRAAAGMMGG